MSTREERGEEREQESEIQERGEERTKKRGDIDESYYIRKGYEEESDR